MKSTLKYLVIAVILAIAVGAVVVIYVFNKPQANLLNKEADFSVSAADILLEYESNEEQANTKYLNKIIDVKGPIAEYTSNADSSLTITLRDSSAMFGVSCNVLNPGDDITSLLEKGKTIVIRGTCSGYSMDVALNNCFIVNAN
jgi:hypothetical protein